MARDDAQEFDIKVTSQDPKEKEEADKQKGKDVNGRAEPNGDAAGSKGDKDEKELSEEDLQLKNELEMLVDRLKEADNALYRPALESLRTLIRTSTSSMTSVPKPLKFLRPHYPELKEIYESWPESAEKSLFAEILSVLAMTYSDSGQRETLLFRLKGGAQEEPGLWGHEYIRHLAAEIGEEYAARLEKETPAPKDDLMALAKDIVVFSLKHNAEVDAVDLLLDIEAIDVLPQFVDKDTYARVCLYMVSCINFLLPEDDVAFLRTAHEIYRKFDRFPEALTLAIRLGDPELIRADFEAPINPVMKKQLAFQLARSQVPIEWIQDAEHPIEDYELLDCLYNSHLSGHFHEFGKELSVEEPRSLEDTYKSHLENTRTQLSTTVDSARGNLASTFVNAFVNAGFGNDKLMVGAEEGNSWIYKNKEHGMLSAAASLGLSLLWDVDVGLSHIDKYTYSSDEYIKAGALMAQGILHSGLRTETDAALALLSEHTESKSVPLKVSAIVGIGIAYAGSCREDIAALLLPLVSDVTVSMEVAAVTSLMLGFIFVGSMHGEITETILQTMMERAMEKEPCQLDDKWARFMGLGLSLLYLGKQDKSDAVLEALKAIDHPISRQTSLLVNMVSFAGTGNVLKVQAMLHECTEHIDPEKEKDLHQAFAVLGIALVTMGEDVGADMALRQMNHLMHYGEPIIRKSVPLALGLASASNPQLTLLDTLSKYSHDNDLEVALNAIFAMGIVGAGTNNARLAQMLRQLAGYYHKEPDCLFMVRIAQGLVHMGKGTISINPFHTDRSIMSRTALAGLLATFVAFTDAKAFILDKSHWMLYFLVTAMFPRFLITLDEDLKPLPVTVRVGQAVDVVGQAGKPRTISGFQTHTTPVRLGTTERAELGTDEYISYSPVLENLVILRKNPGYEKEDRMEV